MALPEITDRATWLAARRALLEDEKELTRRRDRLNTARRELPMVEVTEPYRLQGTSGEAGLLDLFDGRAQLIVYHFMFDPSWDEGCPSCTAAPATAATVDGRLPPFVSQRTTTSAPPRMAARSVSSA